VTALHRSSAQPHTRRAGGGAPAAHAARRADGRLPRRLPRPVAFYLLASVIVPVPANQPGPECPTAALG